MAYISLDKELDSLAVLRGNEKEVRGISESILDSLIYLILSERDNEGFVGEILKKAGYREVISIPNLSGTSKQQMLDRADLIIMEMEPEGSCLQNQENQVKQLKDRLGTSCPRFIYVPSEAEYSLYEEQDVSFSLEPGADNYLYRPFNEAEILFRVSRLLEYRQLQKLRLDESDWTAFSVADSLDFDDLLL